MTDSNIEQKRIQAYQNADQNVKDMYASEKTGAILIAIAQQYRIEESQFREFVDLVGDIMLGFYPKSQLTWLLVNNTRINQENAEKISTELQSLLTLVPNIPGDIGARPTEPEAVQPKPPPESLDEVPVSAAEIRERLHLRPESAGGGAVSSPTPSEEHAPPTSVSRTMAHDIESIQAPQPAASQPPAPPASTVPRFSKPLTDTPTYTEE